MSRRNAARLRGLAKENAINLLKAHSGFPAAQVQIHDQTNALTANLPGQNAPFLSEARIDLVVRIFDIRSSAYLGLVTDMKSQEAYMVILGEFARNAWHQYTGYAFELLPPYGTTGEDAWGRIQARLSYWTHEGYKVLSVLPHAGPTNSQVHAGSEGDSIMAPLTSVPIVVFDSYAHADEKLHDELAKHLKPLEREGIIRRWHDREIIAGRDFGVEIDDVLNQAGIILLLVSPDFVVSEYCWSKEMARAMERHDLGEASVIPIILRPVDWHNMPFGKLLALPKDGKPVTGWANQDEAFLDIAKGIRAAAADLRRAVRQTSSLTIEVRGAGYTTQYQGTIIEVDIGNQSHGAHQVIGVSLEVPSLGTILEHAPGPVNLVGGAPWLPRTPFQLGPRQLTRGRLFFSAGIGILKTGLPREPLAAKLRVRFYLGPLIEQEVQIYSFDTLRKRDGAVKIAADGDEAHDAVVEAQSPADKLRAAVQQREREAAEKQESERRRATLERATLDAAPNEFKGLVELLRKGGESLNEEHLPGVPALTFQPVNHRLDAGAIYSIELSPYAQMHSFTATVRVGLHPNAAQSHADLPRVDTTEWDFQARVDEHGFTWVDAEGKKRSPEQIIDAALSRLADLLSAEPDYGDLDD
jgi:hypothetical protein